MTSGKLRVVDHVAMVSVDGGDEVIADPERLVRCWESHDELVKALRAIGFYASGLLLTVAGHIPADKMARFNELQDRALTILEQAERSREAQS